MKKTNSKVAEPVRGSGEFGNSNAKIPLWLKIVYTAFLAVMVPEYWTRYGPTNFLYFCDIALFLVALGIWTENKLLVSLPAVGILLPQALWCLDFVAQFFGIPLAGLTEYMFDAQRSLFLRGLSFFHGWLPFLIVYLVLKLGYDRRALWMWTTIAWAACFVSYFFLPPPSELNAKGLTPCNVNYVFGMSDSAPQTWLPANLYFALWLAALLVFIYVPTHWMLCRWLSKPSNIPTAAK